MANVKQDVSVLVKQNYLTIGIFFCIILAEIAPWVGAYGGPLVPEITVKYLAVCVIFYTSGLTIKWRDLSDTLKQYKIHFFIQIFSFMCIPLFIQTFLLLLEYAFDLNSWIHKGLVVVGCMPPPISSAVILTKSSGGNEAAAILNSALGSILGIILTPLLLLVNVGISSTLPVLKTVFQLTLTMILPVFLGQISQKLLHQSILSGIPFGIFGKISLLLIIYSSFCDMFMQNEFNMDAKVILVTVLLVVIIQMILLFSTFQVACLMRKYYNLYTAQDIIAISLCSTHKSLTLGMPLLKTLYSGYSHLSQISLPLLIYHPVQLILGGFLVPYALNWVKKHSKSCSFYKRP